MPHASLKLVPGVDVNRTPALNEAAISSCDLIRFIPDRQGLGLVQKLGGWTTYAGPFASYTRALWAWEDTNNNSYLAIGTETSLDYKKIKSDGSDGGVFDITPKTTTDNVAISIATTLGSSDVVITDTTTTNITQWDNVYIQTPISVGGLILFGVYPTTNPTSATNSYHITAVDALGNPAPATTSAAAAIVNFSTVSGSASVTVTLTNHGYDEGSTFPIVVSTTVGGITLYGNYIVETYIDANNFMIVAGNTATSTVSHQNMNGGLARYVYYIGVGPLPVGLGYGIGGYGRGGYGTGSVTSQPGSAISTTDWTLDNWGEILISCPLNGPIYEWSPISGYATSAVINTAPIINAGIVVAMPQRQIIAWGSTDTGIQDPLLIRYCDVDDYTSWIGTPTNQAGKFRIPKGSKIIQCIQAAQQTLVWTDVGLWSMQYVGQPFVYQFNEIGTGCGLIGRKAATSMSGVVYWMGPSQFYVLASGGPQPIACPVWDVIFQDLDLDHKDKIRVAANSRFAEVAWYYPTKGNGGEINAYVKYNTVLQQWDYGSLARTAWINESVLGPPIGAGTDKYIYQHETSTNAAANGNNSVPMLSNFQTGYFEIAEADLKMFVDQVWPDMKWGYYNGTADGTTSYQTPTAQVQLTFYVTDYPGNTPTAYGPYNLTQSTNFISPRFRGRLVSIKISSDDADSFWRIGNIRYRSQPDGKF
jgi:hypothetical protein